VLRQHPKKLNLHTIQLDGTHTRIHDAAEKVGYQKHKGRRKPVTYFACVVKRGFC